MVGVKLGTQRLLRLITLLSMTWGCQAVTPGPPQGTETGNPTYSNDDFDISTEYALDWGVREQDAPSPCTNCSQQQDTSEGIDTSKAPRTVFTDGKTTVTIYFVTLGREPENLLAYLNVVFFSRTFETVITQHLSGYKYDDLTSGAGGADRQEYYFLKGVTLCYLRVELFAENDGFGKFNTLLNSLRFE